MIGIEYEFQFSSAQHRVPILVTLSNGIEPITVLDCTSLNNPLLVIRPANPPYKNHHFKVYEDMNNLEICNLPSLTHNELKTKFQIIKHYLKEQLEHFYIYTKHRFAIFLPSAITNSESSALCSQHINISLCSSFYSLDLLRNKEKIAVTKQNNVIFYKENERNKIAHNTIQHLKQLSSTKVKSSKDYYYDLPYYQIHKLTKRRVEFRFPYTFRDYHKLWEINSNTTIDSLDTFNAYLNLCKQAWLESNLYKPELIAYVNRGGKVIFNSNRFD